MAKFKLIFAEECICNPNQEYADGTCPIYFEDEESAVSQLLLFIKNYAHFKKTERDTGAGKWWFKEHLYWGIHFKVGDKYKHVVSLRPD